MLKKISKMESGHQVLFAIIIGFAVVAFWRGLWGLLDLYLFPDDLVLSLWVSLIIGFIILVGTNYVTKELM